MTNSYAGHLDPAKTPQTEPLNSRQVANDGGGFSFAINDFQRLERFLILGSDGGTYYKSARTLTRENAQVVERCWLADPYRTAETIAKISQEGRAPKNDPAIFAVVLGTLSESKEARQHAYFIVTGVCRTGTHLFQFVSMAKQLGKGFGRGMKRAVSNWYLGGDLDKLAYQVVKYRQREGLTHENVLDMARPRTGEPLRNALFSWLVGKLPIDGGIDGDVAGPAGFPAVVIDHVRAMKLQPADKAALLGIIRENKSLPWEALPTWANNDPEIQGALLPGMGLTAIIRNLANFTKIGLLTPMSVAEDLIVNRLSIADEIKRARVHPLALLLASKVYGSGTSPRHGNKETSTWEPNQRVMDALEKAFYLAFGNAEAAGKRTMLAIDCSASMTWPENMINGVLQSREAAAAMALVTDAVEPNTMIVGFSDGIQPLRISSRMSLAEATRVIGSVRAGHTDCALPMRYAMQHNIPVELFVIYTDNDTNSRSMHPIQALKAYRKHTGIPAKLVVVGMTSTGFSIADPEDAGSLDVVGFDAGAPAVIADFARN